MPNVSVGVRFKRRKVCSKTKTNEEAIEKDTSIYQNKIYLVNDWKLEDDVSIGRGLKVAEQLEKIV